MRRECRARFPRHRGLAIPVYIMARAWPLSDKKPMGHVRAVMHAGTAN